MDALKILSPGVAVEGVVGLPQLPVFVGIGIPAAVDAVEIVVALCSLDQVAVTVGGGGDGGGGLRSEVSIHIVGLGGLLPGGDEALVVDGTNLVDAAQGTIGLYTPGIVMGVEDPLEVSADTKAVGIRLLCQSGFGL